MGRGTDKRNYGQILRFPLKHHHSLWADKGRDAASNATYGHWGGIQRKESHFIAGGCNHYVDETDQVGPEARPREPAEARDASNS